MELVVVTILFIGNATLWWQLRRNDAFLREYVRNSPKAYVWRKLFGEERAAAIIRSALVPLGLAIWITLLVSLVAARLSR